MHNFGRIFFLFILGIVWAFNIEWAEERERSPEARPRHPRYRAYFPNYVLPIFLALLWVMTLAIQGIREEKLLLALCFSVFLHTSIYYVFLSLAMPLLRRYINSRVCAALWLLPNYLYLLTNQVFMPRVPKLAVYVPETVLRAACLVWLTGFLAVMVWKIAGHFRFRREILRPAHPVEDPEVLALWKRELSHAGLARQEYTLVRSPAVTSPLTIGFWHHTIRVVLPERGYTPEELRLIFRHELVHIGREDAVSKFFLAFCAAMCWFNPLMWWAMGKSAEDMELSCDETVLLDADEGKRREYAELLLRTAGDGRGFTTCLSASASSLRYRLRQIMEQGKRFTGSLLAGCILIALFLPSGLVTLALDRTTGAELIFSNEAPSEFEIVDNEVFWHDYSSHHWPTPAQPEALKAYLAQLEIYEVPDLYDFSDEGRCIDLNLHRGEENIHLSLSDNTLLLGGTGKRMKHYFIPEEIDWDYLRGLLYP